VAEKLQRWPLRAGPLLHSARDREYGGNSVYCTLQMGGQLHDPFLEGDLVFTTIDQLLSAYLFHPVSLPARLDNMNAGALIGACIVIDEVHLLDADSALRTTVEMLQRLRGLSSFVVMTATMSTAGIAEFCNITGAQSLVLSDAETAALPTQASKRRTYSWRPHPLTAARVLSEYRGGRAISRRACSAPPSAWPGRRT
jgi:CRISPR-associated endonuclease/helicase Cas3